MRAVFYAYLCLLLICAGRPAHAGTHRPVHLLPSAGAPAKKLQLKPGSSSASDAVLDMTGTDADSDVSGDLDEDSGSDHLQSSRYAITFAGCLTFFFQQLAILHHQRYKTLPPFSGNSSPLYITQRVLRV